MLHANVPGIAFRDCIPEGDALSHAEIMTSAGMSHVDGLSVIFITYIPNVHRLLPSHRTGRTVP